MPTFSIVVAMSQTRVIGDQNQLPWHLPADLQHFKQLTLGKPILMGRKTFESIGRPLPGRRNLVLTRQTDLHLPGCEMIHAVSELDHFNDEIMVIGGAEIYRQFLPHTQTLHITWVHGTFHGDAWFPAFNQQQWQRQQCKDFQADERHAYAYRFETLIKAR